MQTIKVDSEHGPHLFNQFSPIYSALLSSPFDANTEIDLSEIRFFKPLTLLPLAALVHEFGCKITPPKDINARTYLDTVSFPLGLTSTPRLPRATYIPICKIMADDPMGSNQLTDAFLNLILSGLGDLPKGGRDAVSYPIGEITTNIHDHSKHDVGWMFGQYYPYLGYLDICILDNGRGFRSSYKEEMGLDVNDDEAISRALKGCSSKRNDERGFGLWTTKRLITEGLGGECFILSGSAGYFSSPRSETFIDLGKASWNGAIVAFRIPKITSPIDVHKYTE